ncbi:EexN family lipoprotein [Brevundimonas vesicularis]|jgi:hypothetical protein|uniref:EexN family lipoprotein n=1 Tax=Brevundimonas vesicularis TaxID=41276 RepID=UPI0015747868|nr:EexN family lipoprotein [Brevundimonas vesicularis]NSX34438.1 EexN family lipoprotein [Brevundimonas vesicularis]
MTRRPVRPILAALVAAGVAVLGACEKPPVKDAAYFVANPDKIEPELVGCRNGSTDAETCQQVADAQTKIARAKRQEAYRQMIDGKPSGAAAE